MPHHIQAACTLQNTIQMQCMPRSPDAHDILRMHVHMRMQMHMHMHMHMQYAHATCTCTCTCNMHMRMHMHTTGTRASRGRWTSSSPVRPAAPPPSACRCARWTRSLAPTEALTPTLVLSIAPTPITIPAQAPTLSPNPSLNPNPDPRPRPHPHPQPGRCAAAHLPAGTTPLQARGRAAAAGDRPRAERYPPGGCQERPP